MPLFLIELLKNGLGLVANAALSKGKDWVKDKTGVDLDAPMSEDTILKLKQFEMDNERELRAFRVESDKLSAEIEKAYLADVQSARNMQVAALGQDDLLSKRFIYFLAAGSLTLTAIYIGFITFGNIPAANVRFADTILGFLLGTVVSTILNFFFGTSFSSRSKDKTIENITGGAQ